MRAVALAAVLSVVPINATVHTTEYTGEIQKSPCVTMLAPPPRYSFLPEKDQEQQKWFFVPCSYITPYAYPKEWYREGQEV